MTSGENAPRWILRKSPMVRKSGRSSPTNALKARLRSHAVLVFRLEQTLVYLKEVSRIQASLRVNFLALLSESRPERESRRGMNRNAITCRVAFLAFSFAH